MLNPYDYDDDDESGDYPELDDTAIDDFDDVNEETIAGVWFSDDDTIEMEAIDDDD